MSEEFYSMAAMLTTFAAALALYFRIRANRSLRRLQRMLEEAERKKAAEGRPPAE